MRILNVICVRSVLFLTIFAVIADCEKQVIRDEEDPVFIETRKTSEVVQQHPLDQFTGESASRRNRAESRPIIGVRKCQEIVAAAVNGKGTKGQERGRKNKEIERERQREFRRRERDRERNVAGKRGRKRKPLTRLHAKRPPYKNSGGNRTRVLHRQRNHDRRNLEKQYLVRNRTLELFQRKRTDAFDNFRDVVFEKKISPEKIGQILAEDRKASGFRITDLLIPKTLLNSEDRKNGVGIDQSIEKFRSNESETRNEDSCGSAETGSPLFFEKLKSIAMNVSRINKVVQSLRRGDSEVENSEGTEDFGENSYRYNYENIFIDPSVSPWMNPPQIEENDTEMEGGEYFLDKTLVSSVYMPIDEQTTLHEGLEILLSRMFNTLRNATDYENQELLQDLDFDNSLQGDLCQKWIDCRDKLEEAFLGPVVLPACPCRYPSSIFYDDKIWDEIQQRHFRWRDVSGEAERLDVYKPGATYCIRSLLAQGGGSAAAQHCCYDIRRRLLTRGSGAGTPNFVSPEVSPILHERIDILPWRLCKGDFSRFNKVRPPNNGNHCEGNPDEDEYRRQIDTTKHY